MILELFLEFTIFQPINIFQQNIYNKKSYF